MYKSKSYSVNLSDINNNNDNNDELQERLIKSDSLNNLSKINEKEIYFEGDGPLGIIFSNIEEKLVVSRIKNNTVSSEYYELEINMIVKSVNGYEAKYFTYDKMLKLINKIWEKDSEIKIKFIIDIVYKKIFKFLKDINCEEYYEKFIDLGAKDLSDLNYIEYNDLVKLGISYEKRKIISKRLGLKSNLKIPKNDSEVFECDSPQKIIKENENIEMLRNMKFKKKETELF